MKYLNLMETFDSAATFHHIPIFFLKKRQIHLFSVLICISGPFQVVCSQNVMKFSGERLTKTKKQNSRKMALR